jgi:hypothetical protein
MLVVAADKRRNKGDYNPRPRTEEMGSYKATKRIGSHKTTEKIGSCDTTEKTDHVKQFAVYILTTTSSSQDAQQPANLPFLKHPSLPQQRRTIIVLERPSNLPRSLIQRLQHPLNANLHSNRPHSNSLLLGTEHARPHIRLHQPRMRDIRRQPRLLIVQSSHQPVKRRLAGAVRAEHGRELREHLLAPHAADESRDGEEHGFPCRAGLEQRLDGLEEQDGTDGVCVEVLAQVCRGGLRDGPAVLPDAGVGDDDVEGGDVVLAPELGDGVLRVRLGLRVQLYED